MFPVAVSAAVPAASIALDNTDCIVTFGRSCQSIAGSIERVGLINPPVLASQPGPENGYRIVCGYLRVQAMRQLGFQEIPARVLPDHAGGLEALELSLCDNLTHRAFNSIEQAGAVARLLRFVPEQSVIETWLPLLGLAPTAKALDACLRMDGLEDEIKQSVASGKIAGHAAAELACLEAEDRLALYRLFTAVHLSASKQAEIIETCRDLALRDSSAMAELLRAPDITAALQDHDADLARKGEQVRRLLRRRRFPRLTRKEEQFAALAKKLPRAGGVRLAPPQSFEGDTYRLEIAFSRPEGLARAAETVRALAEDERLAGLLGAEK